MLYYALVELKTKSSSHDSHFIIDHVFYWFLAQFSKQTIQWLQLAEGFNRALKVGLLICTKL